MKSFEMFYHLPSSKAVFSMSGEKTIPAVSVQSPLSMADGQGGPLSFFPVIMVLNIIHRLYRPPTSSVQP